ncbi:MAG: iron ABC transporter permease [Alphaproteobacteria bacterium]|nr:iron ABC transporter permease [Alphaproteobacteria bacterium]MBU1516418.1 iron ABC transporter permease [Alphaproteobacteria bacterium]MBU2093345.1 iron ABC transporter permease [Alphaproteobacteria bacterium]MBU2153832.1 iron ABC transporter permease [Alphaproteobacteria bacterium]MBU2307704.1 iron ABC transporter permease [Alphaproteobacteria bacterium]
MKRIAAPMNLLAVLVLLVAAAGSLFLGRVNISPHEILDGLFSSDLNLARLVVVELRLPRTVLAVLVGASLGLSGAVLQGLLRNPLAEPGLLGVSSGAALGAVISIYFSLSAAFALATPLLALGGALGAGLLTFTLGRGGTLSLILAGSAVSGLMAAFLAMALNFAPNPYAGFEMSTWMLGSLSQKSWDHVLLAGPFILAGLAILATQGRAIDALALGEQQAESLGIDLDRARLLALLGVGLSVGAATSVTGSVGFIGLIAPHLVRPFVGYQPSRTLLPSALFGAALLLLADIGTRVLHTSSELRLGVITSLIGTPFFFWLVVRLRKLAP